MPITVIFHYICYSQGSLLPVAFLDVFSVLGPASGSEVETEETFKRFSLLKTKQEELGVERGGTLVASAGRKKESIGTLSPILPLRHFRPQRVAGKLTRNQGRRKEVRAHSNLPFFPFERFEQWDN